MSFTGTYYHSLDAKNRIFIPAGFREDLGEKFYAYRTPDGCITLYNNERWTELTDEVKISSKTKAERTRKRTFMRKVYEMSMDKQGRITLNDDLLRHAALKKDVAIVGMINCVEIWDLDTWTKMEEDEEDYEFNL